jgi:hypothetical protein
MFDVGPRGNTSNWAWKLEGTKSWATRKYFQEEGEAAITDKAGGRLRIDQISSVK